MKTALLALVACIPVNVFAIDYDWTNASGVDSNWLTPGNWNPAGPPLGGAGNFARILAGTTAAAQITTDVPDVQDLLMGNDGSAGIRQVDHTAGIFTNTGWFRMGAIGGAGDVGTYNLSGGQMNAGSYRLVEGAGRTGTVNVSGTGVMRQNDVADIANGDSWSRMGENGFATVNLTGGMMSFDSRLLVGVGTGGANITQTGGVFEMRRGELTLGDSFGAMSATPNVNYSISAGTLRSLTNTGNADTSGNITVAQWDNSNARLAISGSAIVRAEQNIHIADGRVEFANKGLIEQTGGTVTFGRRFDIARTPSGNATYNLSGGTFTQDTVADINNQETWNFLGREGTATFNLSGSGVASFSGRTIIAAGNSPNSTINQTGGLFEVRNHELIIGDLGVGTYNISAGTLQTNSGGTISVGNWNNGNGNLNVSGTAEVYASGTLLLGQTENGSFTSSGTVTQTGGLVHVQGDMLLGNGNGSLTTSGTYNLNGGTLNMTASAGAPGNINRGTGIATFNFNNGRLQDLGNYNLGGTLIQADGVLAPGPEGGAGTSTINANYSLQSDGELEISILDSLTFDTVNVNGAVTLTGSLLVTHDTSGLAQGLTFTILNNDGVDPILGTFFGLPEGQDLTTAAGNIFDISYIGGDGNDVRLLVVPEPAAGIALLGAASLLALVRRRRVP